MKDEVEESDVDDLLQRHLREECAHTSEEFEQEVRATFQQFVENAAGPKALHAPHFHRTIQHLTRLLAATEDRPGVLANALGYRRIQDEAEHRAMMRTFDDLHNDPLPIGSPGGRRPPGRGHRLSADSDTCILCGASGSIETGWNTDCPKQTPRRIRSKTTCAMAVAEAVQKAGITNTKGSLIDNR